MSPTPSRTTSSPSVETCSQLSPVELPFNPGAAPTGAVPGAANASQMPSTGMALNPFGRPRSSRASVTTVNVRLPLTGKLNQSVWPTWLSRPHHIPLGESMRGDASVEIAAPVAAPADESATCTVSVFRDPADSPATVIGASVPDGSGDPST